MNVGSGAVIRLFIWVLAAVGMLAVAGRMDAMFSHRVAAQEPGAAAVPAPPLASESGPAPTVGETADPAAMAEAALAEGDEAKPDVQPAATKTAEVPAINYLELVRGGGLEMGAILLVSVIAMAFALERYLALRRHRVVPPDLLAALGRMGSQKGGFDPRQAYRLCQQCPSTAATVIKAVLLKVGRPPAELEQTLSESCEREATRLYANIRWQNLAFNVAPMLGLVGTIHGMIVAFYTTSLLRGDVNKAGHLADGIYRALVCTLAGLAVAIPAAILAHMLEGRLMKLMGELDDFVRGLLPQLERFEGRVRVNKDASHKNDADASNIISAADIDAKEPAGRP